MHTHLQLGELMRRDAAIQEPLGTIIGDLLEEIVRRNDNETRESSLPSFTRTKCQMLPSAFVSRCVTTFVSLSSDCF